MGKCSRVFGMQGRFSTVFAVLGIVGWASAVMAAPQAPAAPNIAPNVTQDAIQNRSPASLIDAWRAFPNADDVSPPYTYIRAAASPERLDGARSDLLAEYERLRWRLEEGGYADYVRALDAWTSALSARDRSRVPGHWALPDLLANPNARPPVDEIIAVGACQVPDYVSVWSADGQHNVAWSSGLALSDLYKRFPALRAGSTGEVLVVKPDGLVDRYGAQAWNYAGGELAPGAQVVGSLDLSGRAFEWIQTAMANYLAHTVPGTDCREQSWKGERVSARAED